ncbi:MAG TPA: molybdenum cofactor biosynthesis protein MoaE [Thermoanaerobaculia bacterium]|jgi:molybdopterin synthase catalytic subunit|nr:molybdenum cofactor biosynthesis protein MoaE [Thermoanaerobaculia bacterium]
MKIRLLAFASAGDALGTTETEIEMPDGSRVSDLRDRLDRDHPGLAPLWPRLAVAVDGRVVSADAELKDGIEVALLPPVSGGTEACADLVDGPIDTGQAVAAVSGPGRGAVVVFLGTVRDHHAGRPVAKLTYSAYRPMALEGLRRIVADLEAAHRDLRAAIVHRLGEVPVSEASVVIAIGSPHRAAAYEASRTALERLKAEIPIWKREHYADGEAAWREEEPLVDTTSTISPLRR